MSGMEAAAWVSAAAAVVSAVAAVGAWRKVKAVETKVTQLAFHQPFMIGGGGGGGGGGPGGGKGGDGGGIHYAPGQSADTERNRP